MTNFEKDAAFDPFLGQASIREETRVLLSTLPQASFSLGAAAAQAVTILLLIYTLATQAITILWTKDTPYLHNRRATLSLSPFPSPPRGATPRQSSKPFASLQQDHLPGARPAPRPLPL